jgi:hypothetical protein
MTWLEWYNSLAKPFCPPAPATIGLIWQILYSIILVSFGFVFVQAIRKKVPWLVALPHREAHCRVQRPDASPFQHRNDLPGDLVDVFPGVVEFEVRDRAGRARPSLAVRTKMFIWLTFRPNGRRASA